MGNPSVRKSKRICLRRKLTFALISAAMASLVSTSSQAGISSIAFEITATSSLGSGTWQLMAVDLNFDAIEDRWYWTSTGPVQILDSSTMATIGTLNSLTVEYIADPEVSLGFEVQAGASTTTFNISSGLVTFDAINGAGGLAVAGVQIADTIGDGATLTGLHGGGGVYLSQYNGAVPGGTTFAELMTSPVVASSFGIASDSGEFPGMGQFTPIGVPVSSINSQFLFDLSADALASGTSNFVVTPSPGGLGLLAISLMMGRRRRRRD